MRLLIFGAKWCGPCQAMSPGLEKAKDALPGVAFEKVDAESNPGLAERYSVRSLPTLVLLKDGEPVSERVGFQTAQALEDWIRQYM